MKYHFLTSFLDIFDLSVIYFHSFIASASESLLSSIRHSDILCLELAKAPPKGAPELALVDDREIPLSLVPDQRSSIIIIKKYESAMKQRRENF